MHDLIHDLATRVAGSDCAIAETYENNIPNRVHHVSIVYPFEELPRQMLKAKGLRTFLPTCDHDKWYSQKASISRTLMSPNFTCLRVLDVHSCGVYKVPSSIGKLQHLRYLGLSQNEEMTSLPSSIRKLVNLQTLKLSNCSSLERLPEGITKLINLRYLETNGCWELKYMPSGMGKLTSLRRLNKFVVGGNKWGLQLSELNGLNEVRDDISIEGLMNVKDVRSEAKEANLMARQYLHSLTLDWGIKRIGGSNKIKIDDGNMDEILLEGLQPHPKLRELSIERYWGKMFPSWMTKSNIVISLPNIVCITLSDCDGCQHVPESLDQLPFLKSLTLRRLSRVEHIKDNHLVLVDRKSSSTTEGGMSVFFPSLEELVLYYLPNLKGWWRRGAGTSSQQRRPSFPRLTKLEIVNCPELTSSMPIHHHLEELKVGLVPEKLVRQLLLTSAAAAATTTAEGSASSSSSSSSTTAVSKLKSLRIICMDDLESLAEEVLWKLSSLDKLEIVESVNLVSLPVGLQQLTTLQRLEIEGCHCLMALPDWLTNLTSLQCLYIHHCPLLSERCQKDTGEDWPKISHIPQIRIDYQTIQGSG